MTTDSGGPVEGTSRRKFIAVSGAAGVAALAGCSGGGSGGSSGGEETEAETDMSAGTGTPEALSGSIGIAGSSTVFPLATAFAEIFQKEHSGVDISVQSTGSGGGFQNFFCVGETDFNNASRPIKEQEQQLCEENDVNPVELQVATDALTVVVNNENDWAESLTVDQLKEIWSADSPPTTWSDIDSDWPDKDLELFGPSDASGTYDYFIEAIIGEDGPGHRQDYSATEQDRTILQGVEGSQYAMGYLGFAYYTSNSDRVKAAAIDNGNGPVEPSLETAKSGEYKPLSRPLFTYPRMDSLAKRQVAEFARFWMENTTNREIVANDVGYVPLDSAQQQTQMETLQSAIDEASNMS